MHCRKKTLTTNSASYSTDFYSCVICITPFAMKRRACYSYSVLVDKNESLLFCSRVFIFVSSFCSFDLPFPQRIRTFWCFCPRGRDTWPTEGLRAWLWRTKKSPKLPTLFRTAPSILVPCLEQMIIVPTPLFYTILSVSKTSKRPRSRVPKYCVSHI